MGHDDKKKKKKDPLIGQPIGNFILTEMIGCGGMGTVYLAQHTWLGRKKAVKVLHEEHSQSPAAVRRFSQEAMAASACQHEHIVTVEDCGEFIDEEGKLRHYIDMEFLEGMDVGKACLATGRFEDVDRAVKVIGYAADALAAAHERGIVHRDIKPENVFLSRRGTRSDYVKILDFGIARLTGELATGTRTRTGAIFGTPGYMSPEQANGLHPDGRSDVWSLAVLLYRMLAGRLPYPADTVPDFLVKLDEGPPPELRDLRREVPEGVVRAIREAMRRSVDDRPTMLQFKELLLSGDAAPRAILPELSISAPSSALRHTEPTNADAPTMIFAAMPSEQLASAPAPPASTRDPFAPSEPMPSSRTAPTIEQRPRRK